MMEIKTGEYYIVRKGTPYFYSKTSSSHLPQDDINIRRANKGNMARDNLIKIVRIHNFDEVLDIMFSIEGTINRIRKLYIPKNELHIYLVPYYNMPPTHDDYELYVKEYEEFLSYDSEVKNYFNS